MDDLSQFEREVRDRAGESCELCKSQEELALFAVPPGKSAAERCLLACGTCLGQIEGKSDLDGKHWFCLKEAVWSEVPAVQVQSWRILSRLESEDWAQDLLGQVYLDEDTQAWASAGTGGDDVVTLDSNGAQLADGDSVTIIKDLDVKGAGFVAKRGTMVKNIRLIDDPDNIEGRVNKTTLVLKTKFLKKVV